jgi:hypothetical protein
MNYETFMRDLAQAWSQADTLPEHTIGDAPPNSAAALELLRQLTTIVQSLHETDENARTSPVTGRSTATSDGTPVADGLRVARVISDLATIALVRGDLRSMLTRLCQTSVELLDAAAAGVVLFEPLSGSHPTSGSDEAAFEAESRHPDTVRDGGDTSPAGARLESRAVPMCANGEAVGYLVLYRRTADPMPDAEAEVARTLASVAALLVWRVRAHERDRTLASQLQRALDSRIVIEQAKGVLSARHGLTVDEAFEVLRRNTRNRGARIHQVAAAVVERSIELEIPQANSGGRPAAIHSDNSGPP